MPEGGDVGEQVWLHILARDEELDRLDSRSRGRRNQILALDREEPRLLAVLARREELADEPQLRVMRRLDQSALDSSAALARSATSANAFGSDTARSASDLRSSSIPARRTPAMKRL